MERLLSVIRHPQAIFALISVRTEPFQIGHRSAVPYREERRPLAAIDERLCPWRDKDVRAWRALAKVPRMSKRASLAVLRALIGSVSDPDLPPQKLPELSFGGKALDLRPYLCSASTEAELIAGLSSVLDEVAADLDIGEWHWTHRHALEELPTEFRRCFLWGLHLSKWDVVAATLNFHEALGLEENAPLRSALARLLSLADRPTGLEWLAVVQEVAVGDRLRATELVLESGAFRAPPLEAARTMLLGGDVDDAFEILSSAERASRSA